MKRLTFEIVGFDPDYAVHPGETLREFLAETRISQADLARQVGLSTSYVCDLIHGRRAFTAAVALRLEQATSINALFWTRMQAAYDVNEARKVAGG